MVSDRSTEHGTFEIERTYEAAPARVFAAWASAEAKGAWFGPRGEGGPTIEMDFRVGGGERFVAGGPGGASYTYSAEYRDIVPDERIVYTYEMYRDEDRISVSVATVVIRPAGEGSTITLTEQGVFLDGHDTMAQREAGTRGLFDQLAVALRTG